MHYVTPDYTVNPSTGEATLYYRFNGRAVAWSNNSGLKYVLSDHLNSIHGEASGNQSELSQHRYFPFGSDRTVSGASDLADEERFTSQKQIDAGNGNADRELYYYGARWYLPGVGIFTQPDTVVPDYKNPQVLNRFAYGYNNPVKYADPSGHDPSQYDSQWVTRFKAAHHGQDPTEQDWHEYQFSLRFPGSGPAGAWTDRNWTMFHRLLNELGPRLLGQIGYPEHAGFLVDLVSSQLVNRQGLSQRVIGQLADGVEIAEGWVPPGIAAWTFGNVIIVPEGTNTSKPEWKALLAHEYVHALQYRAEGGWAFIPRYLSAPESYRQKPDEVTAYNVQDIYESDPDRWLPMPWQLAGLDE